MRLLARGPEIRKSGRKTLFPSHREVHASRIGLKKKGGHPNLGVGGEQKGQKIL